MKCDLSFITGYKKECKESSDDCVWWERYCKERRYKNE